MKLPYAYILKSKVIKLMTSFYVNKKPIFKVPMEVEVSICRDNWAEKKELDLDTIMESELVGRLKNGSGGINNGNDGVPIVSRHEAHLEKPDMAAVQLCKKRDHEERIKASWH